MLPNWLLGKSKSKLQEILGGGGGGGTTYTAGDGIDISNGVISFDPATTPAIDPSKVDGLDDDLAALAPKTALSNPNLLDNPWFTINQRGKSSYNAVGYTVDGWKIQTDGITASINEDVLTLSNTASDYRNFIQDHEANFWSFLDGKKLTLSLMLSNGTILSQSQIVDFSQNASYCKIIFTDANNKEAWCNVRSTGTAVVIQFVLEAGASIAICAVKLELGSISTLAMDTAPNYATELLKCQRYFITLNTPVDLSTYTSYSNLYTAPSDGYVHFLSAASGSTARTIYTYGNNTTAATDPHFTHSTSANNKAFEIFIKKGLKIYVDGLQSGDTITFYPLS